MQTETLANPKAYPKSGLTPKTESVTIALHWIVAGSVVGLIPLGLYMTYTEAWGAYPIHKSIGVLVTPIILARVIWHSKHGRLSPVAKYTNTEIKLAKITHTLLLICTLAMPVSGMLISGASGHGFGIFAFELVPHKVDAEGKVVPFSEFWMNVGYAAHHYIGFTIISLILIHIAGALKHHFIDKDSTLKRMIGK